MGTIVLGYDASPGAERALEAALELATQFGDRLVMAFGAAAPGPPTEEESAHHRALEELGERVTAGALTRARGGHRGGDRADAQAPVGRRSPSWRSARTRA